MCMCAKCHTGANRPCGAINARKSKSTVPFIPSASATFNEKLSTRKPKKVSNTGKMSVPSNRKGPKMNGKTEYDDKFVEWELPEQHTVKQQGKQYAPTGFYETDMAAFDWESEQKRSFPKKNVGQNADNRVAGVARGAVEDIPTSFAWPGGDHTEPPQDVRTKKHAMSGQMSEHKNKYRWPEMEERVKSARPVPTAHMSPIALDTNALLDNAQQWHSEYDAQCAELRRKQQDLLKSAQTTAGVASLPHGDIPAFYAWEEPEEPRNARIQPSPHQQGHPRGATSEYKNRFVEWGQQERAHAVVPVEGAHLNLFHEDNPVAAAHSPERSSSVLRHDYPGHDVTALGPRVIAKGHHGDNNPKSFAWPSANDQNVDEDESELATRMRKHRAKRPINGQLCSESAQAFSDPPASAYTNMAKPKIPVPGKALDLFEEPAHGRREQSEYRAQYHAFPGAPVPEHAHQPGQAHEEYPTQFAWSLVNGGDASLESPVREKRPPRAGQDMSEYGGKFNWPAPTERASPVRKGNNPGQEGANSIMGLDAADLEASKWQSEYDQQCARLRQKQLELVAKQQPEHVAGVATKQREHIPRNYAWEMPPAPVPSTDVNPVMHHFEDVHSEYGQSFKQWPIAKRESFKPTVVSESLNLFRETAKSSENTTGDKESPDAPLQSEYNDKFHAFGVNEPRQKATATQRGVPLPPQFAWPLVDPPAPPTEKRTDDLHVAFTEKSEYDSSFAWPSAIVPAKIARPSTPSGAAATTSASLIFPVGDSSSAPEDASQWVSEYDAHTTDVLHSTAAETLPTAGMPSFPHAAIPNFYAWMDKTKNKNEQAAPVERPRYAPNQVRSEHDAAFVAPAAAEKTAAIVPKVATESLNLMALPPGAKYIPGTSEYDSKFVGHSAEEVKQLPNPYANKKSGAIEVPKPPQFAWPLVDGEPKTENEKPKETANTPHSEYATQFTWHGLADTVNGRRTARPASADEAASLAKTAREVIEQGPIAVDVNALRASDWQSEYDDRSSALQRKQKELALKETLHIQAPRTAGLVTAAHEECPSFYAWEPEQVKEPNVPRATSDTGTTEYRSNFHAFPAKVLRASAESIAKATVKPAEAFRVGRGTHFEGLSEYDAQFCDKSSVRPPPPPNSLNASMNARYSAANLIAPPPAPAQRVPSSFVGNTSKISKHTENRDNYQWPQSGRLSARKATPVLNSQRSKVVIGVNHPAVREGIKSATRTSYRAAFSAPRGTKIVSATDDAFPDSEFQSDAGSSCPEKENCNYVCNVCSDPIPEYKKPTTTSSSKYRLMGHGEGEDKPKASHALGNTGTMSVDSLGAPERFTSSFHKQGTHLPASQSLQVYRAQSVPHRQRLAVALNQHDSVAPCPIKSRQSVDDTNPVLMNKRYPYVSAKQLNRWSTETGDQFRWRKKSGGLGSP